MMAQEGMQIFRWDQPGYQPLIFSHDWQVALLNDEPVFKLENLGEIERHILTDEVFVLLKGKAMIFTISVAGMLQIEEMIPNTLYNVLKGSWHNLISTPDATWIIIENRDTHLFDTEVRQLNETENAAIMAAVPSWAK
jgi:hypothetical protein